MALGEKLGKLVRPGQVIELIGDLGSGKTTLVKGLAKGLGITKTVTSPSYNIQRSYQLPGGGYLEHFDLYRLSADQVVESEIREFIESGDNIIVIEWARHLGSHLAVDRLEIELVYSGENARQITISATGVNSQKVLMKLK